MLDRILVVDDEPIVLEVLSEVLTREGFQVAGASAAKPALDILARDPHELVLCDIRMPGMDGFEFLRHVHRAYPATDVVLMTGYASLDGAIDAMALGAADYLIKPLKPKEVVARIRAILQRRRLEAELHSLQSELRSRYEIHNVVAFSTRMRAVISAVRRVADQSEPVFFCGETGVGRRFLARTLHYTSKRREAPIGVVNCANPFHADLATEIFGLVKNGRRVYRGQLDRCRGGSLHLAEFESLPHEFQQRVVVALRERRYTSVDGIESVPLETRVTFSVSGSVSELVEQHKLVDSLGALDQALSIALPPLRQRTEDLPGLASAFADGYALDHGQTLRIAADALRPLAEYAFPGNVSEFFALLAHAARNSLDGTLTPELVERSFRQAKPGTTPAAAPMADQLGDREYQLVLRAVNRHPGHLDQAAQELGISRTTLWRRMRKYGITLPEQRNAAPIE
ncbi:MAG: sigma-54-dependent Fis family transcriptional regulator [Planctomycetes bacterium]|nr:sigma-54-dependent Fis family transcriptional regulator [Planctomycetota bacterium]